MNNQELDGLFRGAAIASMLALPVAAPSAVVSAKESEVSPVRLFRKASWDEPSIRLEKQSLSEEERIIGAFGEKFFEENKELLASTGVDLDQSVSLTFETVQQGDNVSVRRYQSEEELYQIVAVSQGTEAEKGVKALIVKNLSRLPEDPQSISLFKFLKSGESLVVVNGAGDEVLRIGEAFNFDGCLTSEANLQLRGSDILPRDLTAVATDNVSLATFIIGEQRVVLSDEDEVRDNAVLGLRITKSDLLSFRERLERSDTLYHLVGEGEKLGEIASKYGMTSVDLIDLNPELIPSGLMDKHNVVKSRIQILVSKTNLPERTVANSKGVVDSLRGQPYVHFKTDGVRTVSRFVADLGVKGSNARQLLDLNGLDAYQPDEVLPGGVCLVVPGTEGFNFGLEGGPSYYFVSGVSLNYVEWIDPNGRDSRPGWPSQAYVEAPVLKEEWHKETWSSSDLYLKNLRDKNPEAFKREFIVVEERFDKSRPNTVTKADGSEVTTPGHEVVVLRCVSNYKMVKARVGQWGQPPAKDFFTPDRYEEAPAFTIFPDDDQLPA